MSLKIVKFQEPITAMELLALHEELDAETEVYWLQLTSALSARGRAGIVIKLPLGDKRL